MDKCNGGCNTLSEISGRICVPNKTENLNLNILNLITRTSESKKLTKHILCKCKGKFDNKKYNSNQIWDNDKCRCECENPRKKCMCGKGYIWNLVTRSCEIGKYLRSNSVICDEIIEMTKNILTKAFPTKSIPTNSNEKM